MRELNRLSQLFTDDLDLARKTLNGIEKKTPQEMNWVLNLGQYSIIEEFLRGKESEDYSEELKTGLKYRLACKERSLNAYRDILKFTEKEQKEHLKTLASGSVRFNGGIGDYIEQLSRLVPWCQDNGIEIEIFCSSSRKQQLKKILKNKAKLENKTNNHLVSIPEVMFTIAQELPKPKSFLKHLNKETIDKNYDMLCCWTAIGADDLLSGWTRSIPFSLVCKLYIELRKSGWNLQRIIDISKWKKWEKQRLEELGVCMVKPEDGDVYDLATLINDSKQIITIDTALVHITVAMDKEVKLLLPLFNDERWYKLLEGETSYKRNCRVFKQSKYGDWKKEIGRIKQTLLTI